MNDWIAVATVDELPADDAVELEAGGQPVAFYRVGDEVFATASQCSHGNARLCDGFLEGFEIECPLHQGRFDVRDGRPLCGPVTEPVRSYPVRVEAGKVLVKLR